MAFIFLVLLADINQMFGYFAILYALYYVKAVAVQSQSLVLMLFLLFALMCALVISMFDGRISLLLLCAFCFVFEYRLRVRGDIGQLKPFLLLVTLFAVINAIMPSQFMMFRDLISDNRLPILDYSREGLSGVRFFGLFTNPNYFAKILVLLYATYLVVKPLSCDWSLNMVVLVGVLLSGSRAGLIAYVIVTAYMALFIEKKFIHYFVGAAILLLIAGLFTDRLLELRVFDLGGVYDKVDPSYTARVDNLELYLMGLMRNHDLVRGAFGNGHIDNALYFFDGDLGNLFFLFGAVGMLAFSLVLIYKFQNEHALIILIALSPFYFAGGVFGDIKTLLVMAFLPSIIKQGDVKQIDPKDA